MKYFCKNGYRLRALPILNPVELHWWYSKHQAVEPGACSAPRR